MNPYRFRWLIAILGLIVLWFTVADSQAGPAELVLAAKTEESKQQIIAKARANLNASDVLTIVRKEKNPRVAGLALGSYLDSKGKGTTIEIRPTAAILRAASERPEFVHKAVTMAATAPEARAIVEELLQANNPPVPDRLLAARIVATQSRIRDMIGQSAIKGKKGKAKAATETWSPRTLLRLVEDTNPEVQEVAIMAAALLRMDEVKAAVLRIDDKAPAGVQAAKLLYQARLNLPIQAEQIERLSRLPPPLAPDAAKATPALSTYNVRVPAWCLACEAIGELGKEEHLPFLLKALDHGDLRIQMDAARAIEDIGSPQAVPVMLKKVPKAAWPVQIALLSAIGAIPTAEAIPELITLLEKEPGRLRIDLVYALASIAGDQAGRQTAGHWRDWWEMNQKSFAVQHQRTRQFRSRIRPQDLEMNIGTFGSFYQLPILSDRVVFVPDTSNSMRGERIESLKKELGICLPSLPEQVFWNVVNFGGVIEIMQPGKMLTMKQAAMAMTKVKDYQLTGGTRMYDAIELAIFLPDVDTLVVLSDGAPVGGQFQSWDRIYGALAILTRYRPLAIDTMEYRQAGADVVSAGLRELANHNRGRSKPALIAK